MQLYKKQWLFIVLFVLAGLFASYASYLAFTKTLVNIYVEKMPDGAWIVSGNVVSEYNASQWAEENGIAPGDRIIKIDGHSPDEDISVSRFGKIGTADTLEVIKDGKRIMHYIQNDHSISYLVYCVILPGIIFVMLLLFSIFLLQKTEAKNVPSITLILFFLATGCGYVSGATAGLGDMIIRLGNTLGVLFCLVLLLHFLLSYFDLLHMRGRILLTLVYFTGTLLYVAESFVSFAKMKEYFLTVYVVKLTFYSIVFLINLIVILLQYFHYRRTQKEAIMKVMLTGICVSYFPYVMMVTLPKTIFGFELIQTEVAVSFLFFLPVSFYYLVTAKQLLDIDFLLNRLKYYLLLSLLPSVLILLICMYVIGYSPNGMVSWLQLSLATYLIITLLFFAKEALDYELRHILFREKLNFQSSLDRFSREIMKVMKVVELDERLLAEIRDTLQIKAVSIAEIEPNQKKVHWLEGYPAPSTERIIQILQQKSSVVKIGDIVTDESGVFIHMGERNQKLAFVWLQNKPNQTQFNFDEIMWIKTIVRYVGLVYENLFLIEKLSDELEESLQKQKGVSPWLLRLFFRMSEKERRRLASDLHDSALQEQIVWYRRLDKLITDANTPEAVASELTHIREGLLDVIYQIRQICNELRPPFLQEMGILEAVEGLLSYTQQQENFTITFAKGQIPSDLDPEISISLYRIVQELLRNAAKHARASSVHITLDCNNEHLILHYSDNGQGMAETELRSTFSHMGIVGIQERVRCLRGTILFQTDVGKGFDVHVTLPVHRIADTLLLDGKEIYP